MQTQSCCQFHFPTVSLSDWICSHANAVVIQPFLFGGNFNIHLFALNDNLYNSQWLFLVAYWFVSPIGSKRSNRNNGFLNIFCLIFLQISFQYIHESFFWTHQLSNEPISQSTKLCLLPNNTFEYLTSNLKYSQNRRIVLFFPLNFDSFALDDVKIHTTPGNI